MARSRVRLQWDPDHDPTGTPISRRAIQLGLRGAALASYARDWILEIEDISGFVAEQRVHAHPPSAGLFTAEASHLTGKYIDFRLSDATQDG